MTNSTNPTTLTLPSEKEITLTRVFAAPRARVFAVLTDPALIPHWWGPRRMTTEVDQMDVRPGGTWRFINRDTDGTEYAFHGVYQEIVAPERVVQTFEWEGLPGHVSVETMTLEEQDGQTTLPTTSRFDTTEDRDGMLHSGMEDGARETWERLSELLTQS